MRCSNPTLQLLHRQFDQKEEKDLLDVLKREKIFDVFKDTFSFTPARVIFSKEKILGQASDILNYNIACIKGEW